MKRRFQRQIEGILEGNGFKWLESEDGVVLRFSSALVHIGVFEWGNQTLIRFRSDVLRNVRADDLDILESVNTLNCETSFGRWAYYGDEETIALEYDLLADHLQEAELMTALASVARLADRHDDRLQGDLGGDRAFE
jgi:hypothetical protein